MNNIPIFIPSKGRYDVGLTWKALSQMGIDRYRVIVEPDEYNSYKKVLPKNKIIVLDLKYKREYETLDGIKSNEENPNVGPGAARNYAWDIAKQENAKFHWCLDDNIRQFMICNNNKKVNVKYDSLAAIERFVDNYENVVMAGMQYQYFVKESVKNYPLILNTRIFSCNLIKTDSPFKWRGRYNEDTILSLDILEAGYCTILFQTYLCNKISTQVIKGGNTQAFYIKEGTIPKSKLLKNVYPNKVDLIIRFGRHHHRVDFSTYKKTNILRRKVK